MPRHKLTSSPVTIATAGHHCDVLNDGRVPIQVGRQTLPPGSQSYFMDLRRDLEARCLEANGSVVVTLRPALRDDL